MVIAVQSEELAIAEALLLALHVAAGGAVEGVGVEAGGVLGDGAVLLGHVDDDHADDEEDEHRREDRPALALAADHAPVGVGEAGRDDQDQQHLDEVGQAARVLEREGGVDVEEAAAVGAELLDHLLRGDRALAEDLGAAGERVDDGGVAEVLDHALGDEEEGADDRDRHQDVEEGRGPGPARSCRARARCGRRCRGSGRRRRRSRPRRRRSSGPSGPAIWAK